MKNLSAQFIFDQFNPEKNVSSFPCLGMYAYLMPTMNPQDVHGGGSGVKNLVEFLKESLSKIEDLTGVSFKYEDKFGGGSQKTFSEEGTNMEEKLEAYGQMLENDSDVNFSIISETIDSRSGFAEQQFFSTYCDGINDLAEILITIPIDDATDINPRLELLKKIFYKLPESVLVINAHAGVMLGAHQMAQLHPAYNTSTLEEISYMYKNNPGLNFYSPNNMIWATEKKILNISWLNYVDVRIYEDFPSLENLHENINYKETAYGRFYEIEECPSYLHPTHKPDLSAYQTVSKVLNSGGYFSDGCGQSGFKKFKKWRNRFNIKL